MLNSPDLRRSVLGFLTKACAAAAGAVDTRPGSDPTDAGSGRLDHAALLVASARTRTLPVVAWYLSATRARAPEWFREVATTSLVYLDLRNRELTSEASRIARALENEGVSAAFRKGVHLCHLYPRRGIRPFNDLDVLVASEALPRLCVALGRLGYRQLEATRQERAFFAVATSAAPGFALKTSTRTIFVDPGFALLLPAIADAWAVGGNLHLHNVVIERISTDDGEIPVLSPAYALIDLVVNLYVGATTMRYVNMLRFQRLTPFMDVLRMARAMRPQDWDLFHQEVERLGLQPIVSFTFGNGERLFGDGLFARYISGPYQQVELDQYGALEFREPMTWDIPLDERMLMDELPSSIPTWRSPI